MSHHIILFIVVPLTLGSLLTLIGRRYAGVCLMTLFLMQGWALYRVAISLSAQSDGLLLYSLGTYKPPLGINLAVDALSFSMLLLCFLVSFNCSIYAFGEYSEYGIKKLAACWDISKASTRRDAAFLWPLWFYLIAAINGVILAADAFNAFVALELLALASVGLVVIGSNRAGLLSSLRYLLLSFLGSLLYLFGVLIFYVQIGHFDFYTWRSSPTDGLPNIIGASLITSGLMLKAAIVPLHFWLPSVHSMAKTAVSAMLSALVVKAVLYLLIRMWFTGFSELNAAIPLTVLAVIGACAMIWGALQALTQQELKRIIAYSTISQLGYLLLCFGLFETNQASTKLHDQVAFIVAIFALNHGIAKALAFLCAGSIKQLFSSRDIEAMRGLTTRVPLLAYGFFIAVISLIGLPPAMGFIAKALLLQVAIELGQWWIVFVVIISTVLAAIYLLRLVALTMSSRRLRRSDELERAAHPWVMSAAIVALALIATFGVFGIPLIEPLFSSYISQVMEAH